MSDDLYPRERRVLHELEALFAEARRRREGHESEDALRAQLAEIREANETLQRHLSEARVQLSEARQRVEALCVDHGRLHAQLEEARASRAPERSFGAEKGLSLERDVFAILDHVLGWEFEVTRVGQVSSHSTDVVLRERRAEGRPFVLHFECKHKRDIRSEDVDKFLRDIEEQGSDAAVFYATSPISSTMLARLAQDDRVIVCEESGVERREGCVLGSVARAWSVARYRRFAVAHNAKFPPSLRATLRKHWDALVDSHGFVDSVLREATQHRKRLRQSVVDCDERTRDFVSAVEVDPSAVRYGPFDALVQQFRRHMSPSSGRFFMPTDTPQIKKEEPCPAFPVSSEASRCTK